MAKTIDHLTLTVGVTAYEHEGCQYDALLIIVAYYKGRGFRVSWQPVKLTGYGYQTGPIPSSDPLVNGGAFVAKEATKNNVKTLEQMRTNLEAAREGIKYYFDQRDFDGLEKLMGDVANYGYPYDREQQIKQLINNNQNNSEDEVMTNENVKVADLIGKSISNGGNAKYTINAIEGEKVSVTFQMGDSEGKPMTMGVAQVEKLLAGGWTVGDGTAQEPAAQQEPAAKQEAPKTEEPAAKTVTMEQPKQEEPKAEQPAKPRVTLRKKQPQTKATDPTPDPSPTGAGSTAAKGRLKFVTYKNGDKEQGRIMGFSADDEAYRRGNDFHGSAYPVNGVLCLSFSKKFTPFAKEVCQALNEGKTVDDVLAMLADYDAKRAAAKAERDAKREGRNHQPSAVNPQPSSGKTYTEAEVAELMRRVIAGDQEAMAIVNAMAA